MASRYVRIWAPTASLAILCTTSFARAAEPTRVVFEGVEGCPSETELVVAVAARGRAIVTVASGGEAALRVSLAKQAAGGFRGSVSAAAASGTSGTRELQGATCREVLDALAIVVAGSVGSTDASQANGGLVAANISSTSVAPLAGAAPGEPTVWATKLEPAPSVLAIPPQTKPVEFRLLKDVTLFGGAMSGLIPGSVVPRLDASFLFSSVLRLPTGRSFLTGLWRMRTSGMFTSELKTADATTKVSGFGGGIAPCVAYPYDRAGIAAMLCVDVGAGYATIETEIRGAAPYTVKTVVPHATVGADVEVRYHFGPRFHLAAKAGGNGVLGRVRGGGREGQASFSSSYLSLHGFLGLGTTF